MVLLRSFLITIGIMALISLCAESAFAQALPGPADIDRVKPVEQNRIAPRPRATDSYVPAPLSPDTPPPAQAREIMVYIQQMTVEGVTVFKHEEIEALYKPFVGQEVSLDTVWKIASAITDKYRSAGYFLSRAYVPAQEVDNGSFLIRVVEGYVGKVSLAGDVQNHPLIDRLSERLIKQKPLNVKELERQLLLLNDLPGVSFQGTLEPLEDEDEAAVHLVLTGREVEGFGSVTLDNTGSRYLGPYQASANWNFSVLPMQGTSVTAITAPFNKELYALSILHKMMLTAASSLDVSINNTHAAPGYLLTIQDIRSHSIDFSIGFTHSVIRQRDTNLSVHGSLDLRNSSSDIQSTTLSRDKTRVLNLDVNYDVADPWLGHNYFGAIIRQGLDAFGSTDAGYINASRLGAKPDFFKVQATYSRFQRINDNWLGIVSLAGQKANGSLYSSEEFGYGGMAVGRAYDTSEISGDDGVSASIEARYQSLPEFHGVSTTPYAFYDIGKIWNQNNDQVSALSASSAGIGMYLNHNSGLSGNLYVAKPISKSIDTPLYGGNGKSPRYMFSLSYKF